MPTHLPGRCAPDSIREFHAASRERYRDAIVLIEGERRTGAVYLWGYSIEMLLKAAYFRTIGFEERQAITRQDLLGASRGAATVGVSWPNPGQLHNLSLWGQMLVNTRIQLGKAYPTGLGSRVLSQSFAVQRVWRETLRYHKNVATAHEVRSIREAADWFLCEFPCL